MAADVGADVEVGGDGAQVVADFARGFFFLVGELRVGVEVFVEVFVAGEVGAVLVYEVCD